MTAIGNLFTASTADTPRAQLSPGGQVAAETTLLLGAVLLFVASLVLQSFDTAEETVDWMQNNQRRAEIGNVLYLSAIPFILGGVVVNWLLTRDTSWWLAWVAAISMTVGVVGLAATYGSQTLAIVLASDPTTDLASLAKALNADTWPAKAVELTTFAAWLLGLLSAAAAVLRSPAAPSAAAFGFIAIPILVVLPGVPAWGVTAAFLLAAAVFAASFHVRTG
jgi:hypothetical protein